MTGPPKTVDSVPPKPARCTLAVIAMARAWAAVRSQMDAMRGRGELRATTMGWNSGVY